MRKLVSLSILLFLLLSNCFLLCCFCLNKKVAYANELTNYVFARAQTSGVVLYKTPSVISSNNVFFEIPQSYFVMLISNFSDEFYRAQYKDVVGYVLKTDITPVAEKPQNPFFEGSFRVFSSDGTDVLSSPFPSLGANVVATVEKFETVEYFGTISGEELIEGRGTTWLFGKTQNGEFGFFYQGLCDQISEIPTNVEQSLWEW